MIAAKIATVPQKTPAVWLLIDFSNYLTRMNYFSDCFINNVLKYNYFILCLVCMWMVG